MPVWVHPTSPAPSPSSGSPAQSPTLMKPRGCRGRDGGRVQRTAKVGYAEKHESGPGPLLPGRRGEHRIVVRGFRRAVGPPCSFHRTLVLPSVKRPRRPGPRRTGAPTIERVQKAERVAPERSVGTVRNPCVAPSAPPPSPRRPADAARSRAPTAALLRRGEPGPCGVRTGHFEPPRSVSC